MTELHLIDRSNYYTKKEQTIDFKDLAKFTVRYAEAWNEYKTNPVTKKRLVYENCEQKYLYLYLGL